jgi:two-component sensor histidine kinase
MKQVAASPFFDRLISWSLDHPLSALSRYGLATLLVTGVALLRAAFVTDLVPWLLFIPTILIVALLAGRGAGLFSVLLSALLAAASIYRSGASFVLTAPQWGASALFVAVTVGVVLLAVELRAAFRRARLMVKEREEVHALLVEKDEQRELLRLELSHRMKNLLAIVQAVAGQTLRRAPDLKAANEALGFRLAALAGATDTLTASEWVSADLYTLAKKTLGAHDDNAGRIVIDGPPICFNAQVALALTLTLHELVTNATKYGALSNDVGHVDLRWSIAAQADRDRHRFHLIWREIGGPAVDKPTRHGFGTTMIERSLQSYLRGDTVIDYRPEGLVFTIDAPLAGTTESE